MSSQVIQPSIFIEWDELAEWVQLGRLQVSLEETREISLLRSRRDKNRILLLRIPSREEEALELSISDKINQRQVPNPKMFSMYCSCLVSLRRGVVLASELSSKLLELWQQEACRSMIAFTSSFSVKGFASLTSKIQY